MTSSLVLDTFNLPPKYTKWLKDDCIEVLLHKYWIRNLLRCHRVPEFIYHDKYSDDEVCELFKQGESIGSDWCHIVISILTKENKIVVPLPRARFVNNEDIKLSLSQIVQYVAQVNYKHLWRDAFKRYNYGCCPEDPSNEEGVPFMNYNELIKEIILRIFGLSVFKLGDSHFSKDTNYTAHPNLIPMLAAVETNKAFFIFQNVISDFTILDCVNFSPAKLNSPLTAPLFVIYQLVHLMRHLNNMGLILGDVTLQDIYIDDNLWIRALPKIKKNVIEREEDCDVISPTLESVIDKTSQRQLKQFTQRSQPLDKDLTDNLIKETSSQSDEELNQLCIAWSHGSLSNYDYLYALNRLAGRKMNQPTRHYVMPWVSDMLTKSGSNWRDLTKSKFRINKGDCQLDRTFQIEPNSSQVAHHVPEVLSEITYYVYLSRITPRSILCKYVRPQWVPGEYPVSIQRLQQWTPDECIPEFYSDPNVFKSIHTDLGDLQVPGWASSPQDFVSHHRAMLECQQISCMLHHWIDLTFGYKLSGNAAVKSKNVCLHLVDSHKDLTKGGVVQLFSRPHPHRMLASPYWSKNPPTLHHSIPKRFCEEDYQGNTCLEDEEPIRSPNLLLSKFISRSKTNLSNLSYVEPSQQSPITLPKDFKPCSLLNSVELLHSFSKSSLSKLDCNSKQREISKVAHYKQLLLERRLKQSQVIGCLIVEIFLAAEVRAFGNGLMDMSFERRLDICKNVAEQNMQSLPKCVHSVLKNLLQLEQHKREEVEDAIFCCRHPCAHSLLQPLLSSLPFPPLLPALYSILSSLQSLDTSLMHQEDFPSDISITNKMNEMKVKNILNSVETLSEEGGACLQLFVPYFKNLLANPETDVISAWYLFDHVARGLGPELTTSLLLDSMLRLYDWELAVQTDPCLVHKRIKLYHRSFLLRLIVRFGLQTFLESFIVPLVEAVGGYHDLDPGKTQSHLDSTEIEDCPDGDIISPLSPMDEDSSTDSDKNKSSTSKDCDDVELTEEDMFLEEERRGPKSAKSLQNLLIDNIDSQFPEDKEVESQPEETGSKFIRESSEGGSWHSRRSFSVLPHYEQSDSQHTKFVCEVCQVSGESLLWLSHRLGPVLTARHLTRNLLRMLALCYSGIDHLTEDSRTGRLPADRHATSVLHCLKSIADLYGEQLIVLQYLPHMIELIAQSKRKMTQNLEGGIIGCLVLLSNIIHIITDSTFADILQDVVIRSVVGPCLRVIGSQSLPSGTAGRKALATKLVQALSSLVARAPPPQRVSLLQSLQRFFLLFSKALNLSPDACSRNQEMSAEVGGNFKTKLKDDVSESPPASISPYEFEHNKNRTLDELKEVLSPEFAYKSYEPFANFFGENLMEQSLRNYSLIKQLCSNYLSKTKINRIPDSFSDQLELSDILEPQSESGLQVGSFGNVVVVGNRIDLQDPFGKSSSPITVEESTATSAKSENMNRHLRGNWVAYWEHEIGRSPKDCKLNIKQIKLQTFVGHTNSVRHIVPLASENSFMSAGRDKTVKLWSLRSQGDGSGNAGPQWTYHGHRKSVLGCGFSDRCRLAVTTDSVVHVWDPWVGRALATLSRPHIPPVNTLIVLPPPSPLALSAATDSSIRGLDLRTCSFVNELKVSVSSGALIRCLLVSPSSTWLAVGQASGIITILDLKMGTIISQWKAHDAEILQLAAVDDQTLISSSLDQTVCVWNASDGKLKFVLKGPSEPVHCLLSWEGEVVSGTTSNRVGVHSGLDIGVSTYTSTRLRSESFKGVLTSMSLLPLNRLLLLGADTGNITLIC